MNEQQDYHDFEPDVRDIARKLNAVDFSLNSRGRETVQQRLNFKAHQGNVSHIHNPYRHEPSRRPVPPLVRAVAAVFVCLIVGVIVAMPLLQTASPGLASTVEPLVSATPTAAPTAIMNRARSGVTDYYKTWFEAQRELDFRYYVPQGSLRGYELAQVAPPMNIRGYAVSTYFEREKWQRALGQGFSGEDVDYLHIAQSQGRTASDAVWLWLPHPNGGLLERPPESFTMTPLSDDLTGYATTEINGQKVLFFRKDAFNFTLTSRTLSEETLLDIALSLTPYVQTNGYDFPRNAPGTCLLNGIELPTAPAQSDLWRVPLEGTREDYGITEIFNGMYPGIDLITPQPMPVLAVNDGVIIFSGDTTLGHKQTVVISHGDHLSLYANLAAITVKCGERVKAGDTIGTVGKYGFAGILHFELMSSEGYRINPSSIITFR